MSNHDKHHHEDMEMEHRLASLADRERSEPDAGFEARVEHAMRAEPFRRVPGRRPKKSTAWIPFVTAACVGIMGYIVWMPMMNRPVVKDTAPASVADAGLGAFDAELMLSSFDAMDTLVAEGEDVGESLEYLELQLELDGYESGSWLELGGAL